MITISKDFFQLIKSFLDLEFIKELLLVENKKEQNFHHALISNQFGFDLKCSLNVLENLVDIIGSDEEFFRKLTKQKLVPDVIREFLDSKLEIKIKLK
jgi:hypothetical protein